MLSPKSKFSIVTAFAFAGLMVPCSEVLANTTSTGASLVIDNIVCEGNESTDCDFITKKYYQQSGEILDPNEVADARLRLGTLIQFRQVDIRLEKGHKRGHVIVVFDVTEASNIQYEWATGLQYSSDDYHYCRQVYRWREQPFEQCSQNSITESSFDFNGTVTDFNFLGSGKRLSVNFNTVGGKREIEEDSTFFGEQPEYYASYSSLDSDYYSLGLSLDYYDPHLFGSSVYYGRARISYGRAEGNSETSATLPEQGVYERRYKYTDVSIPYQLEFGRRFASHSFVSFDINKFSVKGDGRAPTNVIFGLNYGWDSRDDILFATQGSVFNSRYFHRGPDSNYGISLEYTRYHSLWHNKVLSWGLHSSHSKNQTQYYNTPTSLADKTTARYGGSLRFTSITDIDAYEGTYSGWHVDLAVTQMNDTPSGIPNLPLTLDFGYTYQTSSMVYRFSVGLQTTKGH